MRDKIHMNGTGLLSFCLKAELGRYIEVGIDTTVFFLI